MTFHQREETMPEVAVQPRAVGSLALSTKARGASSAIDRLRSEGCMKALFPRRGSHVESISINTSGGLTGGDRVSLSLAAGEGSRLVLTTQAAERAYRAAHGVARMTSEVTVAPGGRLDWLPQELILFEGAALERRFTADLSGDAGLLLVEPVIFGRLAMGEALRAARFRDRIEIRRDGMPLYNDALRLEGDIFARLDRAAVAGGARAMASLVYVGADAEGLLPFVRSTLPGTGGASLLRPDLLVARVVATDGFALRKTLLPALDRLSRDALPTSWRL